MNYCEKRIFLWKLSHYYVLSCWLPESQNKDHIRGPTTIENGGLFPNSKQIIYVWNWNFTIIERNIKAISREYFSSLRFNSGKIFKIIVSFRSKFTKNL